jgi:hypothetical protein
VTAAAFQSALARLIVEPPFRERVRSAGAAALPRGLAARERRRLLAVASDPGLDITCTLHRGFRLAKLLAQLPLTFTVLDADTSRREVELFWSRRPPASFYFLEEAVAFCAHLLARPAALPLPYLAEVAAYEKAGLELERALPPGTEVSPRRVEFRHDPLALLDELAQGRVPARVAPRHCFLVGRRRGAAVEWRLAEAAAAPPATGQPHSASPGVPG